MLKQKRGSIETYRLIKNLKKDEILRLSKMTCNCGHSYLVHPNCAYKEGVIVDGADGKYALKERIGFLDIETFTFNFKADMGIILTYCIKELDGKIIKNAITPAECKQEGNNDKRLVQDLIRDMKGFTKVIGHFSTYFDIPFIRTRALKFGLDFPVYKDIYHADTWFMAKSKLSLKSNSLKNICEFFGIPAKDHKFGFEAWYKAAKGGQKDINFVLDHNIEDVISTELVYKKLQDFTPNTKRSI